MNNIFSKSILRVITASLFLIVLFGLLSGFERLDHSNADYAASQTEVIPEASLNETVSETISESSAEPETDETISENSVSDPFAHYADFKVRGVYISGYMAGSSKMDQVIENIDNSVINTVVIDVKNDDGELVWKAQSKMVLETGCGTNIVSDMPALIDKLHEHGIYVIARCVTFRDPYLPEHHPEWMLHNPDGSVFFDKDKMSWIDPTNRDAWNYIAEIGQDCKEAGFDEIQFDYVRYSTGANETITGLDKQGKIDAVKSFAAYIYEAMHEIEMPVSFDVFGTIINSDVDAGIVGQDYYSLSLSADAISPMIYPSHYSNGAFGFDSPDLYPYETIKGAMEDSKKILGTDSSANNIPSGNVVVRPWLQGFTATWLKDHKDYSAEELKQQIRAVYDSGHDQWIVWNPSGKYPWEAFAETEEGNTQAQTFAKLGEGVYFCDYQGDYMLDEYLKANIKTTEEFDEWMTNNLTNGVPTEMGAVKPACSCFFATGADGEHLLGRNYDKYQTDAMILRTTPSDGYASIGIVDLANLNLCLEGCSYTMDDAEAFDLIRATPYAIADGINDQGLGAALLVIDKKHEVADTPKDDLLIYMSMRAVLDKCANVEEAVSFLENYDMYSPSSRNSYHIFLTDKGGNATVIEWVDGETYRVDSDAVANTVLSKDVKYPDNLGARYGRLRTALDEGSVNSKQDAMELLKYVSQPGKTDWSAVYDLDNFSVNVCFAENYEKSYTFPE